MGCDCMEQKIRDAATGIGSDPIGAKGEGCASPPMPLVTIDEAITRIDGILAEDYPRYFGEAVSSFLDIQLIFGMIGVLVSDETVMGSVDKVTTLTKEMLGLLDAADDAVARMRYTVSDLGQCIAVLPQEVAE